MLIIALAASPSRGRNSDSMLEAFITGIKTVPGTEVEKLYLADLKIETFTFENSVGPLPHETDFKQLTERIQNQATGLVIATPTYNFAVPAGLKNFIDRIRFIALDMKRKNRFGQPLAQLAHLKTYFLVSGGTPKWAEKILFFAFPAFWLRGVFLYFGANVLGAYYSGDVKTFANEKILAKCRAKGQKYAKQLLAGKGNSLLEQLFWRPPQKLK